MRLTAWALVLAFGAVACGGEKAPEAEPAAQPSAGEALPAGGAPATGTVHTVNMEGDGTRYWYAPDKLTIQSGDLVRFVNASGWPHNVAFYENQIPAGAKAVLEQAMAGRTIGPLNGQLLTEPNAVYEISFAGAPAGSYGIFCLPHEALGMVMTLTVQQ